MFHASPEIINAIRLEKEREIEAGRLRSLARATRNTNGDRRSTRVMEWLHSRGRRTEGHSPATQ